MSNPINRRIHEIYHKSTNSHSKSLKVNNFTYRLLIESILKYLSPKFSVLDIGCGAGSISLFIAQRSANVTGIDISQKAISECKKSAKNLHLKNTQFYRSDFPKDIVTDKKYDLIIFTEVIEHIENDILAISKIKRMLKKNGTLILSTPSKYAPLHKLKLTEKFDREVGHLRRYSLSELSELLTMNGLQILEVRRVEGLLRNFLFINSYAGKLVRYINFFASDFFTHLDNISLKLFGESNYIIIARKAENENKTIKPNKLKSKKK